MLLNDPNNMNVNTMAMLAHNRKVEVLNFLMTMHKLSETGGWIKSKKI